MNDYVPYKTCQFAAETLSLDWIAPILMRNVLACWVICGFWDWFLYLSPWQKKLSKFKVSRMQLTLV